MHRLMRSKTKSVVHQHNNCTPKQNLPMLDACKHRINEKIDISFKNSNKPFLRTFNYMFVITNPTLRVCPVALEYVVFFVFTHDVIASVTRRRDPCE